MKNLIARAMIIALPTLALPVQAHAQSPSQSWIGEAPFCQASAQSCTSKGMTYVRSHSSGNGNTCLTGVKVLCTANTTPSAAKTASTTCPQTAKSISSSLTCNCTAALVRSGSIWGSGDYTADSRICRAALHAGVIPSQGGTITVSITPGKSSYTGTLANGVRTASWQSYPKSFRVSK